MAALQDPGVAQRMVKADVLTAVLGMLGKGPGEECTPAIAGQCLATVAHLWCVCVRWVICVTLVSWRSFYPHVHAPRMAVHTARRWRRRRAA